MFKIERTHFAGGTYWFVSKRQWTQFPERAKIFENKPEALEVLRTLRAEHVPARLLRK